MWFWRGKCICARSLEHPCYLSLYCHSCINLRSDDDTAAQIALKLINRKRNQHQISVINYLFIHSFLVLCLTNITLGLQLQSLLEVRKHIHIYNEHISQTSLQYTNRIVFHLLALHEPHWPLTYLFTSRFLWLTPIQQLRTIHESFKTLSVISTEYKTGNRVDSTVRDSHNNGDIKV